MRRALCIARREYLASVKTKGFIVGLFLAPLLMSGGLIAVVALRGQVDVTDKRIVVLDRSGLLAAVLRQAAEQRNATEVRDAPSGKKLRPAYQIEAIPASEAGTPRQRLELSEQVRRGALHAFVEIGPAVLHPGTNQELARVHYYAKGAALDEVRRWLERPLNDELRRLRLVELAVDTSRTEELFRWTAVEGMGLVSVDPETGQPVAARKSSEIEAIAAPMAGIVLMWMILMMGASPLLGAVMEEKNQRIAEVLLGCATPFELMLGKLLGSLGVALTGSAFYLGGGMLTLVQMGAVGFFPFHLLPWFLVYVVLAILMLGGNSVALGAACSDTRDAQSFALPSMLPLLIPMFLIGPVMKEPHSGFATVASFVPPFTPILMLLRQSLPAGVPAWQPWVGLLGMLTFAGLTVFAAARVFRVGLLMQGKAPRFRELVRWAIRG
jgi:ABC-2 type transport system permease protein